ncbi:MAG TPA: hypothetical protein VGG39_37615 [Polyangiaceae bacterium]|jgi:hypothetical protein
MVTANAARLRRLSELRFREQRILPGPMLPGWAGVQRWNQLRKKPWPQPQPASGNGYEIGLAFKRAHRASLDNAMDSESARAMAHQACLGFIAGAPGFPQHVAECAKLVAAESEADVALKTQLDIRATSKLAQVEATKALAPSAGGVGQSPTTDLLATTGATLVFYKCLDQVLYHPATLEPLCVAGDMIHASNTAADLKTVLKARSAVLAPTGAALTALQDKQRKDEAELANFLGQHVWPTATVAIVSASHAVPFPNASNADQFPAPVAPLSYDDIEEDALVNNPSDCESSDFYVGPTHELKRRWLDGVARTRSPDHPDGSFTICVDTSGFAFDEPIELTLSTPSNSSVLWLWPGERSSFALVPAASNAAQIAHLTIGGYPRREILRAVARNSGGPLAATDIFTFIEQAKQRALVAQTTNTAAPLGSFSKQLAKNDAVIKAISKLNDQISRQQYPAVAGPDTEHLRSLALTALDGVTKEERSLPSDQKKAVDALLPAPEQVKEAPTTSLLLPYATAIAQIVTTLGSGAQGASATPASSATSAQADGDLAAAYLCQITSEIVPLVSEDVLFPGQSGTADPPIHVLEYDFAGGFLLTSPSAPVKDGEDIFAIVRNVTPGWSVGAAINNRTVVQRDLTLVGLSQMAAPSYSVNEGTSASRPGFDSTNPIAREMQPPSTQILHLGSLGGGARYDIRVCASNSATDDCTVALPAPTTAAPSASSPPASLPATSAPAGGSGTQGAQSSAPGGSGAPSGSAGAASSANAPATASTATPPAGAGPAATPPSLSHRTIALNSVTVHSYRRLGVRAGIGVAESYSIMNNGSFSEQDLVPIPGSSASGVRLRNNRTEFGVPLLLAWYLGHGRDPTEFPQGLQVALAGGVDVLQVFTSPRAYLGLVFDVYGFGITAAGSFESVPTVNNAVGSVVAPGTALNGTAWLPGGFVGLTTDFDVFETVFGKYFNQPPYPSVAPPSN